MLLSVKQAAAFEETNPCIKMLQKTVFFGLGPWSHVQTLLKKASLANSCSSEDRVYTEAPPRSGWEGFLAYRQ